MAYDRPISTTHTLSAVSLAAGASRNIRGPRGKRGIVRRILGSVTTTSSWTTTAPVVTVTTTAGIVPNRKGGNTYPNSTVIATATLVPTTAPAGFDTESRQSIAGGPGNLLTDEGGLPFMAKEDADLVIAVSAAVGSPAGVADVAVMIDWI